ncbi:hypothetical protein FRB90_001382 [Tulasnella sp. 427]|nr:hypothetical protein FRB90_001382 [Tulasnella sp. 427]
MLPTSLSLPLEILFYILQFVQPPDLPSVILVCKSFRNVAEPLLYRDIDVPNCSILTLYVIRTLLARRDLCELVQTFVPSHYYTRPEGVIKRLKRLLQGRKQRRTVHSMFITSVTERMINIKAVSVPAPHRMAALQKITKLQITTWCDMERLDDLLATLPEITFLELPVMGMLMHPGPVQAHRAPCLQELHSTPWAALQLVPGRPVKRLFLRLSDWMEALPTDAIVETVIQSSEEITALGLDFSRSDWGNNLEAPTQFATALPELEELNIWVYLLMVDGPLFNQVVDKLSAAIVHVPKLRVINFKDPVGQDWSHIYGHINVVSAEEAIVILHRWSEICMNLEKVVFPNKEVWERKWTSTLAEMSCLPGLSTSSSSDLVDLVSTNPEWICLNPFTPCVGSAPAFTGYEFQPQLDWRCPSFGKDLERGWPKGLPKTGFFY